jgi:hypothetical protein
MHIPAEDVKKSKKVKLAAATVGIIVVMPHFSSFPNLRSMARHADS